MDVLVPPKTKRETFSTLEGILQPPINNHNIDASKQNDNAKQNKKQKRSQNMPKQCLGRAVQQRNPYKCSNHLS
jgi:hypothetical protein